MTENSQVLDQGIKDSKGQVETKDQVIQRLFGEQFNKTINLLTLQESVKALEKFYQDNGYVLAQVADIQSSPDGTVTLVIAEGVIENIKVSFSTKKAKPKIKTANLSQGAPGNLSSPANSRPNQARSSTATPSSQTYNGCLV